MFSFINKARSHKSLKEKTIKAKNLFLDILFPSICINCQRLLKTQTNTENNTDLYGSNQCICYECFSSIKINNTLFCPVCRARLAENKKICHFDSKYLLGAAGNYDDPGLQNLIHSFKYKGVKGLSQVLSSLLIKYIENCKLLTYLNFSQKDFGERIENFIVIPIPLYPRRERERGFNQTKLIAENLAKKLNLEISDALLRIKDTKSQAQTKNSEERAKNVKDCFKIKNQEMVCGKNIILIDDVFTSGATINEAVKILKQNGAKKILALVVAKA